jgi:hypothetical protein
MKGVQDPFYNLITLTKLQMAPYNYNKRPMEAITSREFFANISRDGYPSSNKTQAQPWKKVWNGAQGKDVQADGKMIVACALRHDYGMQRPCLYLQRVLT